MDRTNKRSKGRPDRSAQPAPAPSTTQPPSPEQPSPEQPSPEQPSPEQPSPEHPEPSPGNAADSRMDHPPATPIRVSAEQAPAEVVEVGPLDLHLANRSADSNAGANGTSIEELSEADMSAGFRAAREKVRQFPTTPGVYLMKDVLGRVIYVGKAVNLRSRAGSYFLRQAQIERRTADLVQEIADADFLPTDSEVDALLLEARLIKDIQPRFNSDLKDDKTFPYLQINTREQFPRVEFTRKPRTRGVKLYGPFPSASKLRGAINVLQQIFRFRTCTLDIKAEDERWRWFRPCLLASIHQCTAPCNLRISRDEYRRDIRRLILFLNGQKQKLFRELRQEMQLASKELKFEKAARIRDQLHALENLNLRGNLKDHLQPEVFQVDPKKGVRGLQKVFDLPNPPRRIEGVDIAHLQGGETVASLVQFIDGLPFKNGYKRYRIRTVEGVDDFASMREVISRRFRRLDQEGESFPDLLLIDGGKGQLGAAMDAMHSLGITPPFTVSLAKREEELFVPGDPNPRVLSRHSFALRLLQYVRDEAHRFAQQYHHILRKKSTFGDDA